MRNSLALAIGLLASCAALAQPTGMAVSVMSYHAGIDSPCNGLKKFNEVNPGLGARWRKYEAWEFEVGAYKNSIADTSVYASTTWLPLRSQYVEAGLMVGVMSGYCTPVMGAGALILNVYPVKNFGIQLMAIPPVGDTVEAIVGLRLLVNF